MENLANLIRAYALRNALEFEKADASKILPKLFQHGLEKTEIKKTVPKIQKIVEEVNSLSKTERKKLFVKFQKLIPEKEEKTQDLPPLPNLKGKPVLRAAPYPSGALHLGNARTFLLNAMYAEKYNGKILLVMDDTIGSEKKPIVKEAYDLIKEAFDWLKIKYKKPIIYKSDRLKIYYKYAKELIKKDKAYVCHCTQEELKKNRENGKECSCRQFPAKIQLLRWKEMFNMKEGEATLRIKTSMQHPNPAFRDRVLFKISDREHPRTDKKYRVWPTLEMNWAIDDHLLGITHIIRGNELQIETDMEKYIWDIFKWKRPETIHMGHIRLEGADAKISKSKAQQEVKSGKFTGWDDPRTWSIQSLKKRGILPEAIREFVKDLGLTKQNISVPIEALYSINRKLIDPIANRHSFVKDPVEITIKNPPAIDKVNIPVHPDKKETREIKINKIFISKNDFEKLKGKEIRLLHLYNIKLNKDAGAKYTSMEVKDIPKINWVSNPMKCKILLPDGTYDTGFAENTIQTLKKDEILQFERYAFVKFLKKENETYEFIFTHK